MIIKIILIILLILYYPYNNHIVESFNKKLGVILPARYNEHIDHDFLRELSNYLERKNIDYKIIVIRQLNRNFNKGALYNAAVKIDDECDYFAFQDFELLPVSNADYQTYPTTPRHLLNKESKCKSCVFSSGGIIVINRKNFKNVNGYSNKLIGLSDADFLYRLENSKLQFNKCEENVSCQGIRGRHIARISEQIEWLKKINKNPDSPWYDGYKQTRYKLINYKSIINKCIMYNITLQ